MRFLILSLVFFLIGFPIIFGGKTELKSPRVTSWGGTSGGNYSYCRKGWFANGITHKIEPYLGGGDDTSLNAIRLSCVIPKVEGPQEFIYSKYGKFGEWQEDLVCYPNSFLVGYQLKSEPNQGSVDDAAAVNIIMYCMGGWALKGISNYHFGNWTERQMCPPNQAICGFKTYVEGDQGGGDDSTLNNVDMMCCDFPKEKDDPEPKRCENEKQCGACPAEMEKKCWSKTCKCVKKGARERGSCEKPEDCDCPDNKLEKKCINKVCKCAKMCQKDGRCGSDCDFYPCKNCCGTCAKDGDHSVCKMK